MRWSDELVLIREIPPSSYADATDEDGFAKPLEEERMAVYGNKKSVGYGEFFRAQLAGYREEMKFDMYTEEYDGQTLAEFEGKRYKVLRTYVDPKSSGEYIEITLSDLSQQGGAPGG